MSVDRREAVALVFDHHGIPPAAAWAGVADSTARAWVVQVGRTLRGRGHPTLAELAARAPRFDCLCPMCEETRELAQELLRQFAAGSGHRYAGTRARVAPEADPTWRLFAACADPEISTSLFYGRAWERPERRARREARALKVCDGCSARRACLDVVLATQSGNDDFGVWGGTTQEQRVELREHAAA